MISFSEPSKLNGKPAKKCEISSENVLDCNYVEFTNDFTYPSDGKINKDVVDFWNSIDSRVVTKVTSRSNIQVKQITRSSSNHQVLAEIP